MASPVSKRIFGDDIDPDIKEVLKARQEFAGNFKPNESILKYSQNFNGIADLSSRTPFARMWTAVEVVYADEVNHKEYKDQKSAEKELSPNDKKNNVYVKKRKNSSYGHFRANPIQDGRAVYELGNNYLHDNPTSKGPNEPVLDGIRKFIPLEFQLNKNEFMRPPAGITKVSSETKSSLGALIETTVDFVVHNFYDFENIYQKFFLRHGAQVVVDFGWDTATLYDPRTLDYEIDNIGKDLYERYVVKSNGSLEVVVGLVTKYDAKLRDDGGFNCSITINSRNIALLDHNIDKDQKRKIKKVLDISILQYISSAFTGLEGNSTTNRLLSRNKDKSFNPKVLDEWEDAYGSFADSALKSGAKAIPSQTSVKWGVYYTEEENEKSLYVSYGFFEDKILNLEFGFGDKLNPGYESLSFVAWNRNLFLRQLYAQKMSGLSFLYPENWDNTYSTIRDKVPSRISNFKAKGGIGPELPPTQIDIKKGRIPLREIFISVDLIKKSIDNASTVVEFIKYILDEISRDSQDIFKLNVGPINPGDATKMAIVDENHLGFDSSEEDEDFDNMFIFKPFSENSIVKSYDFSMSTPSGNMQNMIAIQSMSPGEKMFPISSFVAQAVAMNILSKEIKRKSSISVLGGGKEKSADDFGVRYLPSPPGSRYKINKFKDDQEAQEIAILNFVEDDYILGGKNKKTNEYLDSITSFDSETLENLEDSLEKVDKAEKGDEEDDKKKDEENENKETDNTDAKVAGTISRYYELLAKKEFNSEKNPIILPIKLSLSIYGISGIIPGNLFRTDYLPRTNFEHVFFHITKVTSDIKDTWTTSFETQMRVRPKSIKRSGLMEVDVNIVLSKSILKKDPINLKDPNDLLQTIKDLRIIDITRKNYKYIDFVFMFSALSDLTLEPPQFQPGLEVGYGEVENKKGVVADKVDVEVGDENNPNKYYLIVQGESWVVAPMDKKGETIADWDVDVYKNSVGALFYGGVDKVKSVVKNVKEWWGNVDLNPFD